MYSFSACEETDEFGRQCISRMSSYHFREKDLTGTKSQRMVGREFGLVSSVGTLALTPVATYCEYS